MLSPSFARSAFDPFREMRRMQTELNGLFTGPSSTGQEFPPINLWIGDNSLVVTAEIPGVSPEDVNISVQQNLLTLTAGTRSDVPDGNEVVWHRRERRQGAFARAVQLPFRVDAEKVQAHSRDGLIEIELHRPEEDRPRKIPVKAR